LARDITSLWLVADMPGPVEFDSCHKKGDFLEGLWLRDVAELFLAEPSGHYQEFNVSPGGAWWCCSFSSYRTRASVQRHPETVVVECSVDDAGWQIIFGVRLDELSVDLSGPVSAHVSAIRYKPQPLFLSSSPVAEIKPDFHHMGCFSPVTYQPLDCGPDAGGEEVSLG
jgi:hypothetical protein